MNNELPSQRWSDDLEDSFQRIYNRILNDKSDYLNQIAGFYDLYGEKKGFYDKYKGPPPIPAVLGHIHSEVSEAWKEWYKLSNPEDINDDFAMELADIIIMTCALAGQLRIDLSAYVRAKTIKNHARTGYCHGKRETPNGDQ